MYYLYYELTVIEPTNSEINSKIFEKIEELRTSNESFMSVFNYDLKDKEKNEFILAGNGYWHNWSKDMKIISKFFPEVLFKLHQVDEEDEDGYERGCNFFYRNGYLDFKTEF